MRAWSYVRVSTDEQITGDGLNRQNRLYLDACALYGWEPAEHQVVDALSGFSGANAQRGGLAKILRAIDNGTIPAGDVLVLEDIDRLSRLPPMESAGILNQIIGAGVQVYIVSMKLLVNKQSVEGFDCLYIVLKMVLAHDESKKKSERIKQSVKARKDAGVKWTGKRPIWLTTNFEVNEIGSTIKLMFKLSALGHGATSIAKHLNKFDRRPDGKIWRTSTISHILRSKSTIGVLVDGDGEEWEDYYPAIISREEFEQVGQLLSGRRLAVGNSKSNNITNLFAGRLKCVFGSVLRLNGNGNYRYAKCLNATHDRCEAKTIKFSDLEDKLLSIILNRKDFSEPSTVNIEEVEAKLLELNKRKALLEQALNEVESIPEIKVLSRQIASLDEQINEVNSSKGMVLKSIVVSKHRANAQSMFSSIKSKFLADPKEVENRRKLQLIIGDLIEAINLSKEKVDEKRWLKVKFYDGVEIEDFI